MGSLTIQDRSLRPKAHQLNKVKLSPPPGDDRDLGVGQGWQVGENRCGTLWQNQACGAGHRDYRWNLAGGWCGQSTGGHGTTPEEELGSGCTGSEVMTTNATDGYQRVR